MFILECTNRIYIYKHGGWIDCSSVVDVDNILLKRCLVNKIGRMLLKGLKKQVLLKAAGRKTTIFRLDAELGS